MPEINTNLGQLRQKRGYSAIQLAQITSVSRQTIYAIEAGTYVPNTAVALRLARALDATVEELFSLPEADDAPSPRTERATLLPGSGTIQPGQAVQLCRVEDRLLACASSAIPWYLPAVDAVVADAPRRQGTARVQIFQGDSDFSDRLLVAGCDPGISVLSRYVQASGVELVLAHRNSSQALALLKKGLVHIAGTHLRDEASGESNLPA